MKILGGAVLVASLTLIVLISVDVFSRRPDALFHGLYMRFQMPVCIVYLAYFIANMIFARRKGHYFRHNFYFLLLSIPYSWLLSLTSYFPTGIWGYVIHSVPTLRAVLALAVVTSFVSKNRFIGLFASYILILALAVYFSSLIFYIYEGPVNPDITSYWSALTWCWLEATTLGGSYYAVTTVGKAIAMLISMLGVMMFPLFTVYLTQSVKRIVTRRAAQATASPSGKDGRQAGS